MNILINASNLAGRGGGQVADSILTSLGQFTQHKFTAVVSPRLESTIERIKTIKNVETIVYAYPKGEFMSLINGRNAYLDEIVESRKIDCVLTVFGPMRWIPKCPHLCGFALPHLVLPESPLFRTIPLKERIRFFFQIKLWTYIFSHGARYFYTENPMITERVNKLIPKAKTYTVTNYYNQIYDQPEKQNRHSLPVFDGKQFVYVGSAGIHKHLKIALPIARLLREQHPDFKFRFVFTIKAEQYLPIPDDLIPHFHFTGNIDISECPSLYEQCDILFQPSLLECFTAVYAEAMRMGKPIVTTNLEFAKGLCGSAAEYYSPLDAQGAADALFKVSNDANLVAQLVTNGKEELKKFDTYKERVAKLIAICEEIGNK